MASNSAIPSMPLAHIGDHCLRAELGSQGLAAARRFRAHPHCSRMANSLSSFTSSSTMRILADSATTLTARCRYRDS
jgi:hypothetical protein